MDHKKLIIIGSTGSVGKNAIQTAKFLRNFKICGLSANKNFKLLAQQAQELNCSKIAIFDESQYQNLAKIAKNKKIYCGIDGVNELILSSQPDLVLFASSGIDSLTPFIQTLKSKIKIALANKEIIVLAGEYISSIREKNKTTLIPVDSEHSAIFQSLKGGKKTEVKKIILTASGGPFRKFSLAKIAKASPDSALLHPIWSMGKKITVDSATLMNKALEIIEARWLFDIEPSKIDVLIHPQSIVHSMVEFIDGSVIAQMGVPDMCLPIQYALTYPKRTKGIVNEFDLAKIANLEFFTPDRKKFPSLDFAYYALKEGGTMPAAMNAANDVAVEFFIKGKIKIPNIWKIIEKTMSAHKKIQKPSLNQILEAYKSSRLFAYQLAICIGKLGD